MAFDPTLLNGLPLQNREVDSTKPAATVELEPKLVPLESTVGTTQKAVQGAAVKDAESFRNAFPATMGETAEAAARSWVTTGLLHAITDPKFESDGTNGADQMKYIDFIPTPEDTEYIMKGVSAEDRQFRIDRVRSMHSDEAILMDNPKTAFLMAGIDPVFWATPAGVYGLAGRAGSLVKAGVGAAEATAITSVAKTSMPMSTEEQIMMSVLEAAAAPFVKAAGTRKVVQGGKLVDEPILVPKDPDLPSEALTELARATKAVDVPPAPTPTFAKDETRAHATSQYGDILLLPSQTEAGKWELTHFENGTAVTSDLFDNIQDAREAFTEAADSDGAKVLSQSWKDSADKLIIPWEPAAKEKVMFEDTGLRKAPKIPSELTPGIPHELTEAAKAVDKVISKEATTLSEKTGQSIMWNTHKTMASYGTAAREFADTFIDNNLDLTQSSVESIKRGVSAELKNQMVGFDNELMQAMANEGAGTLQRIFSSKAAEVQAKIEKEVYLDLLRQDQAVRQGRDHLSSDTPAHIASMSERINNLMAKSAKEQKAAGVEGAEELVHTPGYVPRKWSSLALDTVIDKLISRGKTAKQAKAAIVDMVARSFADANPNMMWETAHDVATATIDRAMRKGIFEDASFVTNHGAQETAILRDMLKASGLQGQRLERVMRVMTGITDEKAKAGHLKHRVDMDYTTNLDLGDEVVNVTDLLDTGVKELVDNHIDRVSAEVAMARKGLTKASDLEDIRVKIMTELKDNPVKQAEAQKLFEGIVANLRGEGHGADLGQGLRNVAAVNRLTVLGAAGIWQLAEYAAMMYQYGAVKTLKYAFQELPGFKKLLDTGVLDKATSTQLKDVLVGASTESVRLQPYVRKYADSMTMPGNATISARLEHATQLVPMLNGMKYVQAHQARIMANHVIDTINSAVRGNTKAAAQLTKYGLDEKAIDALKSDVATYGMDVEKWSDSSWQKARPVVVKMMDEGVLHARLGDMPAWAVLNPVGKFLSMYRGFVFAAHNKLLAGTLARDGFAGVALMMLYQYPITALTTQVNTVLSGKKPLSEKELIVQAFSKMGMAGLFGEVSNILTGNGFRVSGTLPLDRASTAINQARKLAFTDQGSTSKTFHAFAQLVPALSLIPVARGMEALATQSIAASETKPTPPNKQAE